MSTNTNQHSHKVLGLSSASVIKKNVLGDVEGWMNTLYNSITDEYRKEILIKIDDAWNKFDETSLENKLAILDEISALYAGKQETQEALNALRESIKALENGEDESVLDEEDVKKILSATLVDKSFWTDEMIGAPTVIGQEIIGLIGTFGKIQAGNIEGDLIEGKTIQSIPDSDGNTAWKLDNTGGGHLANGKISWNENGKVDLTDVKISFKDINDIPEDFGKGDDGISSYKSIIFRRSNETLTEIPQGGNWDHPIADEWEDGIPSGTGKLWMSYKIFKSDDSQTDEWSAPKLMIDSESFEVAYATAEAISNDYTISEGLPKNADGTAKQNENGEFEFTKGWTDEPDSEGDNKYIYMATASCDNGKWSKWTVSKIKGEKGDKGGSVKLSIAFNNVDELIAYYSNVNNGNNGEPIDVYKDNAHIIKNGPIKEGTDPVEYEWHNHLFVWVGMDKDDESITDGDYYYKGWYDSGQFNGIDGKDGKDGEDGKDGYQYITKFVYKSTSEDTDPFAIPNKPADGSFDFDTNEFTEPDGWVLTDNLNAPVWQSSKTFSNDASFEDDWTAPIMITGKDGEPGEDGDSIEFAYCLTKSESDKPNAPAGTDEITTKPTDKTEKKWTDNPQGIDETYICEWVSMRTGNDKDGWSDWSNSTLWSKYGAKGQDGDGVEYIYYRKNDAIAPVNPTPKDYNDSLKYQQSEWLPNKHIIDDSGSANVYDVLYSVDDVTSLPLNDLNMWSDNPHGVDATNQYEFVSVRKRVNGVWQPLSDPKIWSTWSEDGAPGSSTFKSIVFRRSNTSLTNQEDVPQGGDYNSPYPTNTDAEGKLLWSDAIPNGSAILWASTRTFSTDASKQDNSWSAPAQMTDTADFEVIYSTQTFSDTNQALQTIPIGFKKAADGLEIDENWLSNAFRQGKWTDNASEDSIWMAQIIGKNNVWNHKDWKISKIKGEKGADVYLHVKYAKTIVFDESHEIIPAECVPTNNYGESTQDAMWIGICNSDNINDPTLDPDKDGYSLDNWKSYNWSEMVPETLVNDRVNTTLGTYHISSDHIAGKTIDTSVEINGEQTSGYVKLEDGTSYRIFEMVDGQESGYKDYIAGEEDENNSMGPAWQLRTDGAGYLAKGNIRWDENGNVEFGPDVKLKWNDDWNENIPENDIDEDQIKNIIKGTKISGTQIETGTITANEIATDVFTADTIIGEELVGKTVRSLDDAWKIGKDGDGYLANGKISWGTDGVLNAEINGSFSGGNEGSVGSEDDNGEYPMTWDENHIYINRNLVLGNDVKIDWEKVNSPDDLATTDFVTTQITNNKVTSENIEGTYIKGKTIKSSETLDGTENGDPTWIINNDGSGWLASKKIKFNTTGNILEIDGNAIMDGIENDAKDRFDTLIAEKIEAIDIITDTLITTGNVTGEGTIYIADNDIVVYNNNSPKEVVRISGQDYGDLPENIIVGSKSISINSTNANNKSIVLANDSNLKLGYTYKLYTSASSTDSSTADLPIKIFVKVKNNGSTKDKISVTINSVYVSCNGQIYANKSIHNATKQLEVSSGTTTTFEFGISGDSYYKTLNIPKEFVGEGKPLEIIIGQVTCYNATTYESTNYNIDSVGFSYADSTSDATYKPTLDRVDISATGFRKIIDPDRYFIIKPDNTFEVKYGSNIFGVDANGIYVKVPNANNSMTQGYLEVNSSGQLILKS